MSDRDPVSGGTAPPEHLVVGHVSKVHGTKGELFIWPLTDHPDQVFAQGQELVLGDREGRIEEEAAPVVVERVRPFKRGVLVKLEGLEDRHAVEHLAQRYLLAPVEGLEPLEEGELFYHQVLGLVVETESGEVLGRVREVFETEPTDLLEVEGEARVL